MEHSVQYNKYAERYQRGGCTVEQLRKLVELKQITEAEFEEITAQEYEYYERGDN